MVRFIAQHFKGKGIIVNVRVVIHNRMKEGECVCVGLVMCFVGGER
jgi:hypothetical protein